MGHVLGADGIRPDLEKVKATQNMPAPTDVAGTKRLLGVVNYLSKFIPHLATVVRPIQINKDIIWKWEAEQEESMKKNKALVCAAPIA